MRSRADGVSGRAALEWALHVAALGLVLWVVWRCVRPRAVAGVEVVDESELRSALVRWSTTDSARAVHVRFDGLPDAVSRDWLGAIRGVGSAVTWEHRGSGPAPATAIDAEAVADPRGVVRVMVAGPVGSRVVVGDRLGTIDSARVSHGVVSFLVPSPVRGVWATVGGVTARSRPVDSLVLRRVLVLARAGWEGKFVAQALEGEGWGVDVRFGVAPRNDVVSSGSTAIDTTRYAAVVAVDSGSVGQGAALVRYAEAGGGLVVGPSDARVVSPVAPGEAGTMIRGAATLSDSAPRAGLGLAPVVRLVPGAVAVERRDSLVTVAARRINDGRALQIGYPDTWRWRMAGGDSGVAGHRGWWARLVAAVAYAPVVRAGVSERGVDPAPFVTTVERLGRPRMVQASSASAPGALLPTWVFVVVVVALLGEWGSRRVRGRR